MIRNLLAPIALALLAPAAISAAPATDWTRNISQTPKGAYVLGNPDAKTTLVEYMSYTCSHCAAFAAEGIPPLKKDRVRAGTMKIEFRNFVRDGLDLTAALLARCGGASHFLANHEAIFGDYDNWIAKAQAYKPDPALTDRTAQMIDMADKTGLTALIARKGVTPAAQRACIADKQAMATVLGLTAGAWDVDPNFPGTPTFVLDGKVVPNVANWSGLAPKLPPLPASAN